MEVSREQFARMSFEDDVANGCYDVGTSFDGLTEGVLNAYLCEADYYLLLEKDRWPRSVLERLEG